MSGYLACRASCSQPGLPAAGATGAGCWSGWCWGALGTPLGGVCSERRVLLAWKGIAAYGIVQILSTHPRASLLVRSSCLVTES